MYLVIKELNAYTKEGDATTELEGSFTSGPLNPKLKFIKYDNKISK